MRVIYNNIIPFKGFNAINLFGVVFARREYGPLSDRTLRHEGIHTAQIREMAYVFFYLWYLVEWPLKLFRYGSGAYRNISFEREAYTFQNDTGYPSRRKRFAWANHIF